MKLLCVSCDEQMKLKETRGPDDGSFSIIFRCPKCNREFAMLTNQWETQVVRALDVKIGGKSVPSEPMSATRSFLKPISNLQSPISKSESSPGCPFTEIVNEAYERDTNPEPRTTDVTWIKEAEERMGKIPEAVRSMAKLGIEHFAREKGYKEITLKVLEEAKGKFGM